MKKTLSILILLLYPTNGLLAHGVNWEVMKNAGVGLRVAYETGEPMVEAEVSIYAPEEYKIPYLQTTTNKFGEVLFIANKLGKWLIVVNDNNGHGLRQDIEISADSNKTIENVSLSLSTSQKIIISICIIWGFIGTGLFFTRTK